MPGTDPMRTGTAALTEREKETLRLLLAGHDAKSIARAQNLSVHTVNERLRDARRKLDVPSSREAARLLAQAEGDPDPMGDKRFGVADSTPDAADVQADQRRAGRPLAWFAGGMLAMSLVIAAMVFLLARGSDVTAVPRVPPSAAATTASDPAAFAAAREWVALIDSGRWDESWREAAAVFKSQLTAPQWAAAVEPVRRPLGSVSARAVQSVTAADSLPGAPPGTYQVVQFRTSFARGKTSVETVVLAREASGWKVAGYFIR